MTKEAMMRSVRRRMALTKAAALYESHSLGGMPSSYKPGIVQNGWQASINGMVSKRQPPLVSRQPAAPAQTPAAPSQAYSGPPFWAPAADAVAHGIGRAVEWGAYWPDHLKAWWRKTFRR